MAFSARRTKISPQDTVGVLANQLQKLRASFFLIVEYALDGETGGAATEAQILQRNEQRYPYAARRIEY